jgi:hypothetical protein
MSATKRGITAPARQPSSIIKSNVNCIGWTYGEPSGQSGSGGYGCFLLATSPPISQALSASTLDSTAAEDDGWRGVSGPEACRR